MGPFLWYQAGVALISDRLLINKDLKNEPHQRLMFDALATRALMNHFLILEIGQEKLQATTYRVCLEKNAKDKKNPRWKPDKPIWDSITLECEGQETGVTPFDQFQIQLKKGSTLKDKTN